MGFETFISGRYLRSRRKETFISLITFISTGGVFVGVMALVVSIAVMTGADRKMRDLILGISPHVMVLTYDQEFTDWEPVLKKVEEVPGVTGAAPFVQDQVLLKGPESGAGAVLRGIDLTRSKTVVDISPYVAPGALKLLEDDQARDGRPGIILGRDLARNLGVRTGDLVTLVSPKGTLTPFMRMPTVKRLVVVGTLNSGWYEYDANFAWMNLPDARALLRMGDSVTGVEAGVSDVYLAGEVRQAIAKKLPFPYFAQDWIQMNHGLFKALLLEKLAMFVLLLFIVLVAALNIASTLIMMVMEKKKDIAILKAMGATGRSILKIFVMNGLIIGLVGTFLGVAGGAVLCFLQDRYGIVRLDPTVYPFGTLPVRMEAGDVLIIAGSAVLICFLATLYPAWQASRLDPVETIRYG